MLRGCLAFVASVAVVVGLLQLSPVQVSGQGQAKAAAAKAGQAPKTPWGEPDLQGIWSRDSDTPLQRPTKYANKEFFTEQEREAIDRQVAGIIGREATAERRGPKGTEQDVGGAYNSAIFTSHLRTGRRTSLIVDPPDGRVPPMTAEAQKKRAEMNEYRLALIAPTDTCKNNGPLCKGGKYGPVSPRRNEPPPSYVTNFGGGGGGFINRSDNPEDRSLGERCMSATIPDFGGFRRIVQSQGQITMFYDTGQGQGWQRNILITNTPHLPSHIRQWHGDSRAHWEGNTLVVDVTNFSPKSDFQGAHENLHLVERWTRTDADTIEYSVTIEDPTTWTKPWTVKQDLKRQSNEENRIYYEPRCHEGNYGMAALLVGARTAEKAFAEGRGPDPATMCTAACGGFAGGFADEGEDRNPLAE